MKKIMLLNLNTNKFDLLDVINYYNMGEYYVIEFNDGVGYVPSNRVKEVI